MTIRAIRLIAVAAGLTLAASGPARASVTLPTTLSTAVLNLSSNKSMLFGTTCTGCQGIAFVNVTPSGQLVTTLSGGSAGISGTVSINGGTGTAQSTPFFVAWTVTAPGFSVSQPAYVLVRSEERRGGK